MNSQSRQPDGARPRGADRESWLPPPSFLRTALLSFAGALAFGGVWLLLTASLLPQAGALPLDREAAASAASHRNAALWAARLGALRGDLFAQAAYAEAGPAAIDPPAMRAAALSAPLAEAQSLVRTSLALAPINGAAWLFLADLTAGQTANGEADSLAALQLSYLTAPDEPALARPRIERALASASTIDKDLQELIKGDLREILIRQPQQKLAVLASYNAASQQNQQVFQGLAAEVDAEFARSLRGAPPQ